MKRTGEVILGVLGALSFGFSAVFSISIIWVLNNDDLFREIFGELQQEDPVLYGDIEVLAESMSTVGWTMVIASVLAFVLGIVSMFMLKGNKMPKAAGIILIVVSIVGTLATFGLGFLGGLFYLIAGIMCLARKPKEPLAQ